MRRNRLYDVSVFKREMNINNRHKMNKYLILITTLFVIACSNSENAEITLNEYEYVENTESNETSYSTEPGSDNGAAAITNQEYSYTLPESIKLSTKKEESQCLVKSVYSVNGLVLVDVDFIILETYVSEKDEDGNWFEGTTVVNNNPKIRTYALSRDNENLPSLEEIRSIIESNAEAIFYISAEDGYAFELFESSMPG